MSLDLSSGPLQFDPERHSRFKAGPVTKWCFLIFMLVLVGLLLGNTSIQGIKNWLARGEAEEAVKAIDAEDWGHAVACIHKARSYAPEEPAVLRATITFLKLTESDPVFLSQQLRALSEKEALTIEDQILLSRSLLKAGSAPRAREVLEKLPAEARQQPEVLTLASTIATAEGRGDEARELQQLAKLNQPDTAASKLEKALAQRNSAFEKDRQAARSALWRLTREATETGLLAITHLTVDPQLDWAQTDALIQLAKNHPHPSLPVHLGILSARMRLRPDLRDQIIDEEIARFQHVGGGKLEDIARWLALEKQHARVIQIVPERLRRTSRDLFPIVAQALAEEGRWKELKSMLTHEKPPVRPTRVRLWLAEAESHLSSDDTETRHHLKSCIETARLEKDLSMLTAAVSTAERLSQPDLALQACQHVLQMPAAAEQVEILQKAADLASGLRDTRLMLDYTRQLHLLRPASPAYAEHLAYLRLLLGEEMEVVTAAPNSTPVLHQALSAYRLGDRESLARMLPTITSAMPEDLPAGRRAVLSGLLATAGDTARAFQIAEKVPETLLLDEERAFLKLAR
jgi:hypothetical protein